MLRQLLDELKFTEEKISQLEQRMQECMRPHQRAITLWTSMPGIRETTAWSLVAEIGTNPGQFSQGSNLASWAGMCPGNNESAGKLQHHCLVRELGADYDQRLRAPSLSQSLVRRLQRLGYQVTLEPASQLM